MQGATTTIYSILALGKFRFSLHLQSGSIDSSKLAKVLVLIWRNLLPQERRATLMNIAEAKSNFWTSVRTVVWTSEAVRISNRSKCIAQVKEPWLVRLLAGAPLIWIAINHRNIAHDSNQGCESRGLPLICVSRSRDQDPEARAVRRLRSHVAKLARPSMLRVTALAARRRRGLALRSRGAGLEQY